MQAGSVDTGAGRAKPMMTGAATQMMLVVTLGLIVAALLRWRINGWGALIWLGLFVAMTVVRMPFAVQVRRNRIVAARRDRIEVLLLVAMFATMMVLPLVHLATGVFAFADYDLPGVATAIGAVLTVPTIWLFWRSHADLGRNWSPGLELREGHHLVTGGVYALWRHPMYVSIWLAAVCQPLLVPNLIAGLLVVPAFAAMWWLRVPQEEAMMRRQFGERYTRYCGRVGRLWPRLGR